MFLAWRNPSVEAGTGAVDQFAGRQADWAVVLSNEIIRSMAMQLHRRQQRLLWRPALREQRCDDAAAYGYQPR